MPATPSVQCLWKLPVVVIKYIFTTTVLTLFFHGTVIAQEYSYVHYDVKDGLAGSTVYDLTQDPDGFIWFATDAGVSRFDGTHFKNFTTADGLPETEVIKIFADSKGRVWMAPFKNTVCYYYKGKIHTQKNDSFLAKLKLTAVAMEFMEDREGKVTFFCQFNELITISTDSLMNNSLQVYRNATPISGMGKNPSGRGLVFISNDTFYTMVDERLSFLSKVQVQRDPGCSLVSLDATGSNRWIKNPPRKSILFHSEWGRSLFRTSASGAWLIDTVTMCYQQVFLPGKQISNVIIDKEQNRWFATLGQGVYKLMSQEIKTWNLTSNGSPEIFSLQKASNTLIAGSSFRRAFTYTEAKIDTLFFYLPPTSTDHITRSSRLIYIKPLSDRFLLLALDDRVIKYDLLHKKTIAGGPVNSKSIDLVNPNISLVATSADVILMENQRLQIIDTVWTSRSTTAVFYNNKYFIGTTNGLYIVEKDKSSHNAGDDFNPLHYRTGSFAKDDYGNLWVATFGGGLIQMKGDKPVRHFTVQNGLPSDVCRTLFVQDKHLWVGTDKGICKINIDDPSYPMIRYSTDDGLPSNTINAIYVENDSVYVASTAGLTIFNEKKVNSGSLSDLKILEVSVGGKPRSLDSLPYLKYKENSLRFNFVSISIRSGGNILYRYRLKGLNDDLDSTRQTVLEFLSLPSGSYELELIAVNKFGVASNSVNIPFTIATPFWQTLWFKILIIAIIVLLTWWLVTRRFVSIRKREQEKVALHSRMNDLEQLALRAQMNPHFIFNCLNSIQNFIIHNDFETTNQYLTEFAHLIRQTLDNAAKSNISIDKEVQYLTHYLEMEKMRFGYSFNYSITVDPLIDQEHTHLPTMILQPYVENSIRHGVRYMENGKGLIEILFEKNGEELLCIVQDNGIGREKAATLKSSMHVEYQSKGMMLTAERIRVLNRSLPSPVTIEVIDRKHPDGQPAGTRIVIHFPNEIIY